MKQKKTRNSEPWQHELLSHAPEYISEFIGTAFLMFCVVGAVGIMFGRHSPVMRAIPSVNLRLFLTGLALGGAGSFVAITPLGRLSGAHLNPAMSLGFFTIGRMHVQDLVFYIVAQISGACLGAWGGHVVFGRLAVAVHDALNQPGNDVSSAVATLAEMAATFTLVAAVFALVSRPRTMRWTPVAVIGVVAVIVWLDGNFSGASLNPARSFGPVAVSGNWHLFWIYVVGPCCGSVTAALLHRFATPLDAATGKIFHDLHYRSIFTGDYDHAANQHVRRHTATPPFVRPPLHKPSETDDRKVA